MKVLIVDDEKHVREAIKMLVAWDRHPIEEILEASDGLQASQIIQVEQPEIILTDMMMPAKNGIQLMEWIKAHHPNSKTIVISGYKDYEYMRQAVKHGSIDYILKPIHPEQLNEAVSKAVASWQEKEHERHITMRHNMKINQLRPLYWDKLFSDLIKHSRMEPYTEQELMMEFFNSRSITSCRVCVMNTSAVGRVVQEKFSANEDLLFFSLTNISNEILREQALGYAFRYVHSKSQMILLLWDLLTSTRHIVQRLNDELSGILGSSFVIGIGSIVQFPQGLNTSYEEANAAIQSRNLLDQSGWIHEFRSQENTIGPAPLSEAFEGKVAAAFRSSNAELLKASITQWFEDVTKLRSITPEQFEHWQYEFRVVLSRRLQDIAPHEQIIISAMPLILPLNERGCLDLELWQQTWMQIALHSLEKVSEYAQHEGDVIKNIAKYVEQHYYEEITLQDISERFYLSREYISRRFKQTFGENLLDYIGRIRIDKAKLHLLDPELKVAQIAVMVGYRDDKYFSRVFKKLAGMSPSDYRKKHLLLED